MPPEELPNRPAFRCRKCMILIITAFLITFDILFVLYELYSYSNYSARPLHTFSAVLLTALSSLNPIISFLRSSHIVLQLFGVYYTLTNLKSGWRSVKVLCEFLLMTRFFLVITGIPIITPTGTQVSPDTVGGVLLWLYHILNLLLLPCKPNS